jgi:flagellar assembly protein FliH
LSTDQDQDFIVERFDAAPDPEALCGVLFAEEFEAVDALPDPPMPAAPQPPPAPALTEADLAAARMAGYEDGLQAALTDLAGRARLAQEAAMATLTQALTGARDDAARATRDCAETLSRVVLRMLADLLPELSARHGAAEAAGLVAALLPMLSQQPRLAIRAHPHTLPLLQHAVAAHAGETRIGLIGSPALAEGDVSIEWQDGAATRDSSRLLAQIAAALAPLGIVLDGPAATPKPQPAQPRAREMADVH